MKTLFLTVVLLGLVAALQAQGPLFANSEKLNVRLVRVMGGVGERHDDR
jgi:hypothetical protein